MPISPEISPYRAQLENGQWFRLLPSALQEQLLREGRLLRLSAGQRLFSRGDPPCGLYAVLSGSMRVGAVSRQGKEALLTLVEAPYWFGEISLFDGLPRTHDAYAEGPCQLMQVPQSALLTCCNSNHSIGASCVADDRSCPGFRRAGREMSLLPAAPRLARRLLQIAEGYGEQPEPRRVIQLAQEQLA